MMEILRRILSLLVALVLLEASTALADDHGGCEDWQEGYHLAPAGATTCDSGVPAPISLCEQIGLKLRPNPKRKLQIGSGGRCLDGAWGQVPLGCSVASGGDGTAHFKTSGNVKPGCAHKLYQLVCTDAYHLAPEGSTMCDSGVPAPLSLCEQIGRYLRPNPKRKLQIGSGGRCLDGSWGQVPLGCSVQTGLDGAAHFKTSGNVKPGCAHKMFQLVCTGAKFISCQDIKTKNPRAKSGQYTIHIGDLPTEVYCEMEINGGGYTFVSPSTLPVVNAASLARLFTKRSDVLLKLRNVDGTQTYTVIKHLRRKPLSVQLSANIGHTNPQNKHLAPYLFLGTEQARYMRGGTAGFISNNKRVVFRNCGGPNAYFAFLSNPGNKPAKNYHSSNLVYERQGVAVNWRRSALLCKDRMPEEYFYLTEVHYGGCGCYTSSDRWSKANNPATGATIGIR